MPAAKRTAHSSPSGKVWPVVALSYRGEDIPMDADLRELLPAEVLEACLERGEASHTKPD